MIRALPFLLLLALTIFCVVDAITSRDGEVRHLPKIAWILLILVFTPVGAIAWLVAGRPRVPAGTLPPDAAPDYPEYDRPGRAMGPTPESDEEFLRRVRERAEEQRRKAAEQRARQQRAEEDE